MEATLQSPFGRTILGTTTLTIGNTANNQLVLNDASVMAQHAILRPEGQGYNLTDLGSTYGTFVNEQRLPPHLPRELRNGDTIRVGNVQLTYNTTTGSSIPPTVYAVPGQVSDQGYSPTIYAPGGSPPPSMDYSSPAQSSPLAPPPAPAYNASNPYETPAGVSTGSGYVPPPPAKKRGRRGLWITLGTIGGVLLLIIILFVFVLASGPSMTPTQTFQSYCKDLKAHDAQAAYNLYSQAAKKQVTQADLAMDAKNITDCVVGSVNDTAGTGALIYVLPGGSKVTDDYKLINENNEWKIDAQTARATPTLTLYNYCNTLKQGDYKDAYDQYSSALKTQMTEAQFQDSFGSGKPSECTLSKVDDNAGTGVVTFTFSGGPISDTETLVKENGTWKINSEQPPSTPTLTLTNYCAALKQGDYQTAYNQIATDVQKTETEAQFAANFNTNKVTNCTLSNVDDTAGTGTVTYTLSNGSSVSAEYTLAKEQDIWKIVTEKAKS